MELLNNKEIDGSQYPQNSLHPVSVTVSESDINEPTPTIYDDTTNCKMADANLRTENEDKHNNSDVKWKLFLNFFKQKKSNLVGLLLALFAGVSFALFGASFKASRSIDPMQILVIRSLMQVIITLLLAICRGESIIGPKGRKLMLWLQGIIGGLMLVMLAYSFQMLPLGDAATIVSTSSVVVMIMAFIFLKEPCSLYRIIIICLVIIGVVLISKPPFLFHIQTNDPFRVWGYGAAILGSVFMASNTVTTRKCKDIHYSVLLLYLSLWSLVISTALVIWKHDFRWPKTAMEWSCFFTVGIFGFGGQVLTAKALCLAEAGQVAVLSSIDIVIDYLLQVYLFGENSDYLSITGAILVTGCVILMFTEERLCKFVRRRN